ncbi:transcription elongation factor SPT4-A-like [Marmota marmota marmota]|uniref:transcription elongation factor SPT4-A-like n=1 Tax=Marmota marmota marmota TaxID=9994 RepID=UPI0007629F49|nr:transcription elongation factor SPT4-A-like [Marmota marmota marmota]
MALETVPKDLWHLRACLLCSLVKTIDQFEYDGCDNCDAYIQMKGNREVIYDCTSSSFDGIIAMMSPEDSWVSKWQRVSNFKPGVYAVSVTGRLPQGIVWELKSGGVAYKSRDLARFRLPASFLSTSFLCLFFGVELNRQNFKYYLPSNSENEQTIERVAHPVSTISPWD